MLAAYDITRAIFVAGPFGHGLKRIVPWGSYADKIDCSLSKRSLTRTTPTSSARRTRVDLPQVEQAVPAQTGYLCRSKFRVVSMW
jgi:hypothetical protein